MRTLYLDNAATSWPKPETVPDAVSRFIRETGANPGRSGHRMSIDAARMIYSVREKIAHIAGVDDPLRVVLTKNATESLNICTLGLLKPGDHVIVSGLEHNALMRPLRHLEQRGVSITVIPVSADGDPDPDDIRRELRRTTRMVCCTHASNVTGAILPVAEIGKIAHEAGALFCVDAAQSAGSVPIEMRRMNIDLLALTGHKGLLGPQGTGALVLGEGIESMITPLVFGGTGSLSESEMQPDFLPDRFESGTLNCAGYAGLSAGIDWILEKGIAVIGKDEERLALRIADGLSLISGITVYGGMRTPRTGVVSFNLEGRSPSEISQELDEQFGIMTRPGLHCAPQAHKTIGTFPQGTVRLSVGVFTTDDDVDYLLDAVMRLC